MSDEKGNFYKLVDYYPFSFSETYKIGYAEGIRAVVNCYNPQSSIRQWIEENFADELKSIGHVGSTIEAENTMTEHGGRPIGYVKKDHDNQLEMFQDDENE